MKSKEKKTPAILLKLKSMVSKMSKAEAMSKADIIYKKIQEYKKEELERIKRGEEHV